MHDVLVKSFRLDGTERTKSDVQHDGGNGNALFADSLQQLGREMQAGRRRGRTAVNLGVNRLIAVL